MNILEIILGIAVLIVAVKILFFLFDLTVTLCFYLFAALALYFTKDKNSNVPPVAPTRQPEKSHD